MRERLKPILYSDHDREATEAGPESSKTKINRNADKQIENRRQASEEFDEKLTKLEEAFLAYLDLFVV